MNYGLPESFWVKNTGERRSELAWKITESLLEKTPFYFSKPKPSAADAGIESESRSSRILSADHVFTT